jgi:hypothetical protein
VVLERELKGRGRTFLDDRARHSAN